MLLIQVLIVLFAFYAVTRVMSRFRQGTIGRGEWFLWSGFWISVAIVVLVPDVTQWFAGLLGVGRGVDAVFYVTLVALFYLVFRLHLRIRGLEQQITDLVRKLALERAEKPGELRGQN